MQNELMMFLSSIDMLLQGMSKLVPKISPVVHNSPKIKTLKLRNNILAYALESWSF